MSRRQNLYDPASGTLDRKEVGALSRAPDSREAAARVRAARAYRDIKQTELAKRLGISLATLRRIENGDRPMSIEDLGNVAKALDIPVAFMLRGMDAVSAEPDYEAIAAKLADIERAFTERITELEERQDATDAKFRDG